MGCRYTRRRAPQPHRRRRRADRSELSLAARQVGLAVAGIRGPGNNSDPRWSEPSNADAANADPAPWPSVAHRWPKTTLPERHSRFGRVREGVRRPLAQSRASASLWSAAPTPGSCWPQANRPRRRFWMPEEATEYFVGCPARLRLWRLEAAGLRTQSHRQPGTSQAPHTFSAKSERSCH